MTEGDRSGPSSVDTLSSATTNMSSDVAEDANTASKAGSKKKRSGTRAVIFSVVLLGVAAAAWSILGKRVQPDLPGSEPGVLDRVTDRIAGGLAKQPVAPSIVSSPSTPAAITALEDRIQALERARSAGESGDGVSSKALNDLEVRVAELEQLVSNLPTDFPAGIGGQLDPNLENHLSSRPSDLEQRVAQAERRGAGVQIALAFALGQLRAGVVDARSYGSDLDRVSALSARVAEPFQSGSPGARMVQAIDQLRASSSTGVPTLAELQESLNRAAADILRAAALNPDSDWTDSLRARLSSVVRVRRTGELEGTDPEARLARAEARLKEGNLAAAYAELIALEGPVQSAASGWLAAAEARIKALRGLDALDTAIADVLAATNRLSAANGEGG